jgi:hypothetical protein
MKGEIIRGLIELITNCDDSYGEEKSGKIRIEVEHHRGRPWRVIVRDRAKGMRKQRMTHAIGDIGMRTSGFESGESVRGNLGRGAKDLAAFGPVTFESICDDYLSTMTLEADGSFDDVVERKVQPADRERLGIPRGSGTIVSVLVEPTFACPKHLTILDRLSKHYQLRDINSDPRREVTLVDLNTDTVDGVRYGRPSLTEVFTDEIPIPEYPEASALVTIFRSTERYENPPSDSGRPEGLLLKGRRAIYENSLFSYENNPHSHWFSGSVICDYVDLLALEYDELEAKNEEHEALNPIPIISRSRDGLEHEHPFYKALARAVDSVIGLLVEDEEKKASQSEVREDAKLRRSLDALGKDLGQLIDEDLRDIDDNGLGGAGGNGTDALIRIIPSNPVLYMGEDKTLSVIVSRSLEANELELEVDPEGVIELLDVSPIPLIPHPQKDNFLIARVHVRPIIEEEQTFLTIRCGSAEAVAVIEVRPERDDPDPDPPIDLEFEYERYRLSLGKRRHLLLRAPVDVINSSSSASVRVTSSDAGVVIMGDSVSLIFDEDQLCFVGRVTVEPRVIGANATLTATIGESTARCQVDVTDKDPGGPKMDFKIIDEAQGRYRAYVDVVGDQTIIKILGRHSAVKRYLGPAPEFPYQGSKEARIVIAEIIAGEAARMVMRRKFATSNDSDVEGFYADHMFYLEKYLARCHKILVPEGVDA